MTLTDFLQARIAEDEAALLAPDRFDCDDPAHWDSARIRAECETKRRIVKQYEQAHEGRRTHPHDLALTGALLVLHGACQALALPYADHPDYQPEWHQ